MFQDRRRRQGRAPSTWVSVRETTRMLSTETVSGPIGRSHRNLLRQRRDAGHAARRASRTNGGSNGKP